MLSNYQQLFPLFLFFGAAFSYTGCPSYPETVPLTATEFQQGLSLELNALDSYLQSQMQSQQIPGMTATLVYDQEIVWFKGYGYADYFNKSRGPPNLDTIFRIASCTKVFTGALMFVLRDLGLIELDDPLTKFMPDFKINDPYSTNRQISLRELASHTSGLPREMPFPWSDYATITQKQVLDKLRDMYLLFPQFSRGHYSNLGIILLGRALEAAMKDKTYEQGVKDFILTPLGMQSSGFKVERPADMGVGVIKNGPIPQNWIPAPLENLGWGNPMGGLFASSRDMAAFLSFFFRTNHTRGSKQPLDGATINEWATPVVQTHDGVAAWGMPWEFNRTMQYWAKNKQGELDGFRTVIGTIPELKLGLFIGILQSDVPEGSAYCSPALTLITPGLEKLLQSRQRKATLPPHAAQFPGTYIDILNNNTFSLFEKNGGLFVSSGPFDNLASLTWMPSFAGNVFRVQGINDDSSCRGYDDGFELEFAYFSSNGKINGVHFMGDYYTKLD